MLRLEAIEHVKTLHLKYRDLSKLDLTMLGNVKVRSNMQKEGDINKSPTVRQHHGAKTEITQYTQ